MEIGGLRVPAQAPSAKRMVLWSFTYSLDCIILHTLLFLSILWKGPGAEWDNRRHREPKGNQNMATASANASAKTAAAARRARTQGERKRTPWRKRLLQRNAERALAEDGLRRAAPLSSIVRRARACRAAPKCITTRTSRR